MPNDEGEFDNLRDALDDWKARRGPRDRVPKKPATLETSALLHDAANKPATFSNKNTTVTPDGITATTETETAPMQGVGRPVLGPIREDDDDD